MEPDEESRDKVAVESSIGPVETHDHNRRSSAGLDLNQANEIACSSAPKKQLPSSTTGATIPRQRPKQTGANRRRHLTELIPTKGSVGSQARRRSGQQPLGTPHPAKLGSQKRRPRRKGLKLAPATAGNLNGGGRDTGGLLSALINTTSSEIAQQMNQQSDKSSPPPHSNQSVYVCSGCQKPIRERYLFQACDKFWHNKCLKCDRCQAKLGELGSSFYLVGNMNLCRHDYYEMLAHKAICAVCDKLIYASEMVMRARNNVYHLECFACQLCGLRFCVGDRFHLCENKIVCQFDYDEHIYPIQQQHYAQFNPTQTGAQFDRVPMQPIDQQDPVGSLPLGAQLTHDGSVEQQQAQFTGSNQAICYETLVYHTMEPGNSTLEQSNNNSAKPIESASGEHIVCATQPPATAPPERDEVGSDNKNTPRVGAASPVNKVDARREATLETGSG